MFFLFFSSYSCTFTCLHLKNTLPCLFSKWKYRFFSPRYICGVFFIRILLTHKTHINVHVYFNSNDAYYEDATIWIHLRLCMKLREREKGKDKKRQKEREGQERATRTYTSLTIVITNFKSYLIRFLLHIA